MDGTSPVDLDGQQQARSTCDCVGRATRLRRLGGTVTVASRFRLRRHCLMLVRQRRQDLYSCASPLIIDPWQLANTSHPAVTMLLPVSLGINSITCESAAECISRRDRPAHDESAAPASKKSEGSIDGCVHTNARTR